MPDNQATADFMQRLLEATNCRDAAHLRDVLEKRGHYYTYNKLNRWRNGDYAINAEQMHALQTQLGIKV